MVPPPEAYDWSNVYGIAFKFQSDTNAQEGLSLNGSYAETVPLTAPEISTLFTSDANDEGPRILGLAPVTALREAFCNSIILDMANLDELTKGHIAQLIDSCPIRFVKPGSPNQRIRNSHEFDSAGREAVRRAEATNNPEPLATVLFNINRWKFKRKWKTDDPANYFNSIYTDDNNIPSGTTDLVHTTTTVSNPVKTPLDSIAPNAPRYTWTWTYSPNSGSVSFRRVQSDYASFKRATSFSPPVQQQDKSPVTAPSVTPSALTSFSHRSVPPYKETVTFRCLPEPATVPLKPPSRFPLSYATADDRVFSCPIQPKHSEYSSCLKPNHQPVPLRLTKRHRNALKIKLCHLHANILSMNWFYDTID
eukprot:jgi/Psemu1/38674/gm1.38674_g